MTKSRKLILALTVVCLVIVVSVAGTLAYLSVQTSQLENNFTFLSDGLKATISEPSWDEDNAKNLVPGSVVPKDPQITNNGQLDEWVAVKATFCYGPDAGANAGKPLSSTDLTKVLNAISIDWNASDWTRFDDSVTGDSSSATALSQTFFYNTVVKAANAGKVPPVSAGVTNPLFTNVTIKTSNSQSDIEALKTIGGFQIFIEGCAVQSTITETMTTVIAGTTFTFTNTPE